MGHIQDVRDFMLDAGVSEKTLSSGQIVGASPSGVSDCGTTEAVTGSFPLTSFKESHS